MEHPVWKPYSGPVQPRQTPSCDQARIRLGRPDARGARAGIAPGLPSPFLTTWASGTGGYTYPRSDTRGSRTMAGTVPATTADLGPRACGWKTWSDAPSGMPMSAMPYRWPCCPLHWRPEPSAWTATWASAPTSHSMVYAMPNTDGTDARIKSAKGTRELRPQHEAECRPQPEHSGQQLGATGTEAGPQGGAGCQGAGRVHVANLQRLRPCRSAQSAVTGAFPLHPVRLGGERGSQRRPQHSGRMAALGSAHRPELGRHVAGVDHERGRFGPRAGPQHRLHYGPRYPTLRLAPHQGQTTVLNGCAGTRGGTVSP